MFDIFNEILVEEAKKRGIERVPAVSITKPTHTNQFLIANNVDRSLLKSGVHVFIDLELLEKQDNVHHRNSGLDSTSAKLCAEQGALIGINIANIRKQDPIIIGRIMQNIELCRQHKTRMAVISSAKTKEELLDPSDVTSLLLVLGMSPSEAKQTVHNLEKTYKEHLFKTSNLYVKEGVRKKA